MGRKKGSLNKPKKEKAVEQIKQDEEINPNEEIAIPLENTEEPTV